MPSEQRYAQEETAECAYLRSYDTILNKRFARLPATTQPLLQRITATRDTQFGDYQANLSLVMSLGKQTGRDSLELAKEIATGLQRDPLFASVEVAGRGFINLRIADDWLIEKRSQAMPPRRFLSPLPHIRGSLSSISRRQTSPNRCMSDTFGRRLSEMRSPGSYVTWDIGSSPTIIWVIGERSSEW